MHLWHDYGPGNTSYYNKTVPDINADQMYARAVDKGPISTIPEIPGLLVWQPGHIGIYIGGGQMVEATVPGRLSQVSPVRAGATYVRY